MKTQLDGKYWILFRMRTCERRACFHCLMDFDDHVLEYTTSKTNAVSTTVGTTVTCAVYVVVI
jgi:hypothetical protein